MKEYQKIETVFERDIDGTKKLIEGKFRNPVVEYLKDNTWTFTEKVDGTNIRVLWDGHTFAFGGRTDNAQIPTFLFSKLQEIFMNNAMEQMFEQLFGDAEVIIFGEGYGNKIQKVGSSYINDGVDLRVFDISINGLYLKRLDVEDICTKLGLKIVPIVMEGTIEDAVSLVKECPPSVVALDNCVMEGLVGVPTVPVYDRLGNRIIVKIKVRDFQV